MREKYLPWNKKLNGYYLMLKFYYLNLGIKYPTIMSLLQKKFKLKD